MFKIERDSGGSVANFRLIGHIQSDGIACIRKAMDGGCACKILDVREVNLVDLGVIRFLISCEDEGIELAQCPPWVREWMVRERMEGV
jgi:hypothetical protein